MTEDTVFGKIARGEAQANIVYEDDLVVAFRDLYPAAPTHILIIPRKPIPRLCDAAIEDKALLGHMLLTANQVAESEGLGDKFRLVINNGADAGQSVFHLHMHVIGGRPLTWPPG
ncbi:MULTISPECIES: histidine triad nucleotide-binding protein [unclassified Oceanobacter]|jgi:histidine triad (HIT) family protein|uniref:histidine triad nucleotide-binding protein n=1 Tax=unclassified Oceanobacter TaxID=2620260 RepID=UPI0026E119E7|nr:MULTISPECIES: histidine triad nucleotide-binding protein [unclassified Oceanobacter]MDO6682905.1 histidine triad nucleotide-binding protein [Oceanobacter sp. 5_MG-2023]MDP2504985.1 histidine triad nucleotide-binding protein [Oceanobacter sp. 3_MG-2023]MDP2547246.1 histidine triad nucleotide-binding protein [Oceanobacter sp. 4_MG-2023]